MARKAEVGLGGSAWMPVERRGLVIVVVCTGAGPENSDGRLGAADVDATGAGGAADENNELAVGC